MKTYRHGDVQLIPVAAIPNDAALLKGRKELAYGEATGHAHRIDVGDLFQTKNGELYLNVKTLGNLSHEEHKTRPIPAGAYRIAIKRQYASGNNWTSVKD